MTTYEIDYNYKVKEFGSVVLDADSIEDANERGFEYIRETWDEVSDIEIETVREVK